MTGRAGRGRHSVRAALLGTIRFYQRAVSPALPPRCRFHPTCSAYAVEAIERHGAGRGSWLALRRLLKCAPWHPGGVDLVPEVRDEHPPGGTGGVTRSSSTAAPSAASSRDSQVDGDRRPDPSAPPARRRAQQEESSVA